MDGRRVFGAALAASLAAHAATLALWPPRPLAVETPVPLTIALAPGDAPAPGEKGAATAAVPPAAPAASRSSPEPAARRPERRIAPPAVRPDQARAMPPAAAPALRESTEAGGGHAAATPAVQGAGKGAAPVAGGAPSAGGGEAEALPVTPARFRADYLSNPPPAYPDRSRELGEEGRVEVKVRVSPDGRAAEVLLHRSSGFKRLDDAALQAVARWRFVPARRGDTPIEAWLIVPMPFRLEAAR